MEEVLLISPTVEYENQAQEYIKEFKEYNSQLNGVGRMDRFDDYSSWLGYLDDMQDSEKIPVGRVPNYTYFLVRKEDNRILGMTNIRKELNQYYLQDAGHIGYSIRPTERKKGYGEKILSLALSKCKELSLIKVLLTCDKHNIASAKIIQKNNGILEDETYSEMSSIIIQRYWIQL